MSKQTPIPAWVTRQSLTAYIGAWGPTWARRKLGISHATLSRWRQRFGVAAASSPIPLLATTSRNYGRTPTTLPLMTEDEASALQAQGVDYIYILDIEQGLMRRCFSCREYWPYTLTFYSLGTDGRCKACSIGDWRLRTQEQRRQSRQSNGHAA